MYNVVKNCLSLDSEWGFHHSLWDFMGQTQLELYMLHSLSD